MDLAAMLGQTCPLSLLVHVLSGSVGFPLGYVCLAFPSFPGPPVLKGMLWAGLLWGVAECIMTPLLGAGVSSAALGGLPAALWALLGYLVYGATLGGLIGTAGPYAPGADRAALHPNAAERSTDADRVSQPRVGAYRQQTVRVGPDSLISAQRG